jgi:UDP-glucose:(heptosyl)LPS alpha-1,3-glucosyltransferase
MCGKPFRDDEADVINTFGVGRGADVVTAQSCHRGGMDVLRSRANQFLERPSIGFYDRVSLNDERILLTSPVTQRVIAVSELVKSQIEELYNVNPEDIAVVPNGVNFSLFEMLRTQVDRPSKRKSLGFSPDDFVLLFVGNEFGRKGLKALLQSLVALDDRNVQLLVVGSGNQQSYRRFATELGIATGVHFAGNIPSPEAMYLVADAFVLPSLYEPFGLVVLEAMAAGVPVITSKATGAVEGMLNRRHALLLEYPASVEELLEAVRLLKGDESLRKHLIASGFEKAKEFTWGKVAQRTLGIYDDVQRWR